MRIVQIEKLENGAHLNQITNNLSEIPIGWAVIPEYMATDNFPFGDLTTEEFDGVMTVTSWTAGKIPDPQPRPEAEPSANELMNILLGVEDE